MPSDAIQRARKAAADQGLANVRFEGQDVTALRPGEPSHLQQVLTLQDYVLAAGLPGPGGKASDDEHESAL